jgi:hypothetical protein
MASYVSQAMNILKDLPSISRDTLSEIEELDQLTYDITIKMDKFTNNKVNNPSKFQTKDEKELKFMKVLIEDLADRKAQLAVQNYDLIDQHIVLVDKEIKLLEGIMLQQGRIFFKPIYYYNLF